MKLPDFYQNASPVAIVIISIALMLFFGFGMTRITRKLRLPDVTAYILSGVLIGPYCLNLIPKTLIEGMDFLSDIALAFIAFTTGEFFRISVLRKNGMKVVIITLVEAVASALLVFILSYFILALDLAFSIVLASLAIVTAPTSTVMTIRQTGARGDFVDTLLQVVALDDLIGLLGFSIALSIAMASSTSGDSFSLQSVVMPLILNVIVMLLGGFFGFLLKLSITNKRSNDNRLIILIAFLFTFCGICALVDVSPLLGCMSMGMVYINLTGDDKLFKQLNYFSPPILLLFFMRSGLNFRLDALMSTSGAFGSVPLLFIGVLYLVTRIIGKYAGSFVGSMLVKKSKSVRTYLGLALIPQAGVAIGLAALGARTLGGETGEAFATVILSSSILCEIIGPAAAKASLYLSGSYSNRLEDVTPAPEMPAGRALTPVEEIVARLNTIRAELPAREARVSDEEQAFTEAAEEQYAINRQPHLKRRYHL